MMPRPGWNGRGVQAAKNPQIEINMGHIVEFDLRYRRAVSAKNRTELLHLAAWAESKGLTLGHKAHQAAQDLT